MHTLSSPSSHPKSSLSCQRVRENHLDLTSDRVTAEKHLVTQDKDRPFPMHLGSVPSLISPMLL